MSEHDPSRREFLRRAATGAGAVAGAGMVPEALAQTHEQDNTSHVTTSNNGEGLGAFLNRDDAATIEAFTERLVPGGSGKPGARDARVLNYLDLALAGAYADLQEFYRH